ncbi:hypothetical protein ACNKHR_23840 [Shigella flexneri]
MKRITVKPGEGFVGTDAPSPRGHWVGCAGTAKSLLTVISNCFGESSSIYIPLGATHWLENPGKIPLDLIEVRSGSYLRRG